MYICVLRVMPVTVDLLPAWLEREEEEAKGGYGNTSVTSSSSPTGTVGKQGKKLMDAKITELKRMNGTERRNGLLRVRWGRVVL